MKTIATAEYHVVGASFAGSLLAARLARHGRVALIDRREPGTRLKCGGGMPLAVLERLELDVPFVPVCRGVIRIREREFEIPQDYAVVDRRELDRAVFAQALDAGAEFVRGRFCGNDLRDSRAVVESDGQRREFTYRKLVLATGTPAHWPRAAALVEVVDQPPPYPDTLYMLIPDELVMGYFWIFPMPGGRVNVGIGSFGGRHLLPGLLAECKRRLGIVGPVLARGGGFLPLRPRPRVMEGNTVWFGDAAGMAYPLNGEGLSYIARYADLWADSIRTGADLNRRWRATKSCWKLRGGAAVRPVLVAGERLGLPLYRWGSRFGAWARRRGWRRWP